MIFIQIITIIILIIIFWVYVEGRNNDIVKVRSTLDSKEYFVRNLPDKVQASNNIAKIREKLNRLVAYLKKKYPDDKRIIRLGENYRETSLSEAPESSEETSYSINKGEKIVFCLRQRDSVNRLVELNTILFVALHELSHILTESVGHTEEFWENFAFVLRNAIDIGIYSYQPFHKSPVTYCGTIIADTPLK